MRYFRLLLYLTFFANLFLGCKKEVFNNYHPITSDSTMVDTALNPPIPIIQSPCPTAFLNFTEDVNNFDTSIVLPCIVSVQYHYQTYGYKNIQVNPCNNDEIAYERISNTNDIYRFDFCTGVENLVVEDILGGFYSWSVKGWLLFIRNDNNIYKIKADGTEETQLTFSGDYNNFPVWNPEGTKFVYSKKSGGNPTLTLIADEQGQTLDTIKESQGHQQFDWYSTNEILFGGYFNNELGIAKYDLSSKSFTVIVENAKYEYLGKMNQESSTLYWKNKDEIWKTDVATNSHELLLSSADNRKYDEIAVPNDEAPIYGIRNEFEKIDACNVNVWSYLIVFDKNGENEKKLNIP